MSKRVHVTSLLTILTLFASTVLIADDAVKTEVGPGYIMIHAEQSAGGYHLRVSGPEGFFAESSFTASETPYFDFSNSAGQELVDGTYRWELRGLAESRDRRKDLSGGTAQADPASKIYSGTFTISGGTAVDPDLAEQITEKDQVFSDDVIMTWSACIGMDCAKGESFGFDTLRLKENILRINFEDTSDTKEFPTTDWRIAINDAGNGGDDYFSIQDATADRAIFTVRGGAPQDSLFVGQDGKVGLKTSTPAADLHMVSGNTPTLRLDQDGSDGFIPQVWEVAGNEQSFFIRDLTDANTIPFLIDAGAPKDSLHVTSDGNIGVGTRNPSRPIHIVADTAQIAFENTAGSRWNVGTNPNDNFGISLNNSGGKELEVTTDGKFVFRHGGNDLATLDAGELNATGAVVSSGDLCGGTGCGGVLDSSNELQTIEDHAQEMWSLGYLPAVGATPDGEATNLNEKIGGLIIELEKAHAFIAQLNSELTALKATVQGN